MLKDKEALEDQCRDTERDESVGIPASCKMFSFV